MTRGHVIAVEPGGRVVLVYDDALQLRELGGEVSTRRASHVEPGDDGLWWADLRPVSGPVLGPYERRADALAAEVDYLHTQITNGGLPT